MIGENFVALMNIKQLYSSHKINIVLLEIVFKIRYQLQNRVLENIRMVFLRKFCKFVIINTMKNKFLIQYLSRLYITVLI